MTIYISQYNKDEAIIKQGKLGIVRMGSSEFGKLSLTRILFAIGKGKTHIPYRDAKFTRYLYNIYIEY